MGPFSVFTVFVGVISCFGAVDKTSSSFSAHGKIGNFIIIITVIVRRLVRRSVGQSTALWKNTDRIRMPFGIVGRTGPGMRQVVGFGIGPGEGVLLGANLGRAIVTNGDLLSQRRGPLPKLLWADLLIYAY